MVHAVDRFAGKTGEGRRRAMVSASLSKCANPECETPFRKLGEGKLYVRRPEKGAAQQKALWLCAACVEVFDLRYDRRKQEFVLVKHRRVA